MNIKQAKEQIQNAMTATIEFPLSGSVLFS